MAYHIYLGVTSETAAISGFKTDKQTAGMRDKEGGTERNNSLAGRMKTKAEKEIGLLSWLRECGVKKKER